MGMRLPSKSEARETLPIAISGVLVFIISYSFCSWLTDQRNVSVTMYIPEDELVPFYPSWSIIYLSINLLIPLAFFFFHTRKMMIQFVIMTSVQVLIASLFFVLMPVQQPFEILDNPDQFFYRLADEINLNHNYFPSLHVSLALSSSIVFQENPKEY